MLGDGGAHCAFDLVGQETEIRVANVGCPESVQISPRVVRVVICPLETAGKIICIVAGDTLCGGVKTYDAAREWFSG